MESEEIKLKPCPFCGGKARFLIFGQDHTSLSAMAYKFQIECDRCGATNNEVGLTAFLFQQDGSIKSIQDDRFKVANAWNRRAKDAE